MFEVGKLGMMDGYAHERVKVTYHMFMLKTERVVLNWDVKWLQLVYGDWLDFHARSDRNDPDLNYDPESNSDSNNDDEENDSSPELIISNDDYSSEEEDDDNI